MAERVIILRAQEERERREKLKRKRMSQGLETIAQKHPIPFLEDGMRDYDRESEGLDFGHQTGRRNGNGNGNGRRRSKSSRYAPKAMDGKKDIDCNDSYLSPTSQFSPGVLANGVVAQNEPDLFDMAVGQRTPEPRAPSDPHPLPSSTSISAGLLEHGPLKGLHLVVTHVKDTLEDDVDVAENILASLERLEKDKKLSCTFSLSEQGRTFYF